MKKMFMIAMACYGLCAKAQLDTPRDFIYLFNDSLIEANRVRLRQNAFSAHLNFDQKSIQADKVKFFGNQYGVFANTRQLSRWENNRFVEQVESGKLNLYSRIDFDPIRFEHPIPTADSNSNLGRDLYYNKGFGDLKVLNYRNLSSDLRDNTQSIDFLEAYRKQRNTGTILAGVGVATCFAGLIAFISSNRVNANNMKSSPEIKGLGATYALMGIGFGLGAAGGFSLLSSHKKLMTAVDYYNQ